MYLRQEIRSAGIFEAERNNSSEMSTLKRLFIHAELSGGVRYWHTLQGVTAYQFGGRLGSLHLYGMQQCSSIYLLKCGPQSVGR